MSILNSGSHLVPKRIVDKNGVPRTVYVSPSAPSQKVKLPAPDGSSATKPSTDQNRAAYASPIQRIAEFFDFFGKAVREVREEAGYSTSIVKVSPVFLDYMPWLDELDTDTLRKVKEIMDVPANRAGKYERSEKLVANTAPEEISVIHANREFLEDRRTGPQFLVDLASALGPEGLDADGRIHNIAAHCEVQRSFEDIVPFHDGTPGVSYVESAGLLQAVHEHPERSTELAAWGKVASKEKLREALTTPGIAIEAMETIKAYPDHQEKIMDFIKERGTSFSKVAYEGFEGEHDALENGWL